MELIKTPIEGLWVIQPKIFFDPRGYFFESYNKEIFDKKLPPVLFVQDNQSESQKGVLRGMHFQSPPHEHFKLVYCLAGKVLDAIVDLRQVRRDSGSCSGFSYSAL